MHALSSLLTACLLASFFGCESQAVSAQGFLSSALKALVEQDASVEKSSLTKEGNSGNNDHLEEDIGKFDKTSLIEDEEDFEYGDQDFEDDETSLDLSALHSHDINSLTHLHSKGGEILIPCFGMWWPVGGGGGPTYDYGGGVYYYDDYKRKKKRSRKQKKAAKMKKRKKS